MKIKSDFVTNSSSTAFVLISRAQLTRNGVRQLVGIRSGSPLEAVADGLYDLLKSNGSDVQTVPMNEAEAKIAADGDAELFYAKFSEVMLSRIRRALAAGQKVQVGRFRGDGDAVESLICCDSFEAENDQYYLNALRCSW